MQQTGDRSTLPRFKDECKHDLKTANTDINYWEGLALERGSWRIIGNALSRVLKSFGDSGERKTVNKEK